MYNIKYFIEIKAKSYSNLSLSLSLSLSLIKHIIRVSYMR